MLKTGQYKILNLRMNPLNVSQIEQLIGNKAPKNVISERLVVDSQ